MKEHPIIFNTEMVRAILDGRKTQTRRVINPPPGWRHGASYEDGVWYEQNKYGDSYPMRCPYGNVGDTLWVRETWAILDGEKHFYGSLESAVVLNLTNVHYRADAIRPALGKWRPSIHMPRWASRISLEITDIRVERVQDILEADAWKEGFAAPDGMNRTYDDRARHWFRGLWDSINAGRGHGWDNNPWVWVIYFKKVKP